MKLLLLYRKFFRLVLLFIFPVIFFSCLEDPVQTEIDINISETSLLLKYLESKGDFINNIIGPKTFDADFVHSRINYFKIIDLRSEQKFSLGHIPNSINVSRDSIFNYIENNVPDSVLVVLVSESGQLSGYISSLFWLAGYYNIYSLNFGIASWNTDLAIEVFDERSLISSTLDITKTNQEYTKSDFQPLPEITLINHENLKQSLLKRIKSIASQEFLVDKIGTGSNNLYLVCYGHINLYNAHSSEGPDAGHGHPIGAILYRDALVYDLRSSNDLQTLPPDKKIVVYTFSGQLSAFVVAYLKVLGYDAYSLNYGASLFANERLLWGESTNEHMFDESKIYNFEYEK